jgi:hypothetical protein
MTTTLIGEGSSNKEGLVMNLRRLAVAGPIALLALPAAAVADPTLSVDRPCYTPGQAINATGGGYTPTSQVGVDLSVESRAGTKFYSLQDPLTADNGGNISVILRAPDLSLNDDTVEDVGLAAYEEPGDQSSPFGTAFFKLSTFDVFVAPWDSNKVDPTKATTFRAYGFEGLGPVLYAHYLLHGKLKKTVRIGGLTGACGNLTKRMKQFPFRPVPAGDWRVNFDTSRAYSARADGIRYAHVKVPASKAVR